jgi:hypothetical protein
MGRRSSTAPTDRAVKRCGLVLPTGGIGGQRVTVDPIDSARVSGNNPHVQRDFGRGVSWGSLGMVRAANKGRPGQHGAKDLRVAEQLRADWT